MPPHRWEDSAPPPTPLRNHGGLLCPYSVPVCILPRPPCPLPSPARPCPAPRTHRACKPGPSHFGAISKVGRQVQVGAWHCELSQYPIHTTPQTWHLGGTTVLGRMPDRNTMDWAALGKAGRGEADPGRPKLGPVQEQGQRKRFHMHGSVLLSYTSTVTS